MKKIEEILRNGGLVFVAMMGLAFFYHLMVTAPESIRAEANSAAVPRYHRTLSVPEIGYLHTPATPEQSSFVLVRPAVVLNGNSWDFIVSHAGGTKKIESIDLLFTDRDKLEYLKQTAPVGVPVVPTQYSLFDHIDVLYPKGFGSLFAKQLTWTPYSFNHGHFVVDVSASTGRFHEDIFIENVSGRWLYAYKTINSDSGKVMFQCRQKGFPPALARQVVTGIQCFPPPVL